jgi:hypothetical protein
VRKNFLNLNVADIGAKKSVLIIRQQFLEKKNSSKGLLKRKK